MLPEHRLVSVAQTGDALVIGVTEGHHRPDNTNSEYRIHFLWVSLKVLLSRETTAQLYFKLTEIPESP